VIEIVADEVGPSLRWATAQVTRNERRGGDGDEGGGYNSSRGGGGGGGQGNRGGGQNSGGGSRPGPAPDTSTPATYDYDEEPF
jgi:single-strand DNA-binding protein